MSLEDGRIYFREELAKELGEDVSALTDAELAKFASEKTDMKVSYMPKFVPPFLCEKKRR